MKKKIMHQLLLMLFINLLENISFLVLFNLNIDTKMLFAIITFSITETILLNRTKLFK